MQFLTNTYDPGMPDAPECLVLRYEDMLGSDGRERAWQQHTRWLSDKIIGEPQATEAYTVAQLQAMHMVGVYRA